MSLPTTQSKSCIELVFGGIVNMAAKYVLKTCSWLALIYLLMIKFRKPFVINNEVCEWSLNCSIRSDLVCPKLEE